MKREPKNERVGRGRGRGRKDSLFFLPHPLPALLLAPFFARSLTRRLLSRGSPGGRVGGSPDNGKLFSNNGQIMHMNIISPILVWHFFGVSNTHWLEKILKRRDSEPYLTTNKRRFTTENLPTIKTKNNNIKITGGYKIYVS